MQRVTAFTENEEIYPFFFFSLCYKPGTAKKKKKKKKEREEREATWVRSVRSVRVDPASLFAPAVPASSSSTSSVDRRPRKVQWPARVSDDYRVNPVIVGIGAPR